jgi:hypothetical protein
MTANIFSVTHLNTARSDGAHRSAADLTEAERSVMMASFS